MPSLPFSHLAQNKHKIFEEQIKYSFRGGAFNG